MNRHSCGNLQRRVCDDQFVGRAQSAHKLVGSVLLSCASLLNLRKKKKSKNQTLVSFYTNTTDRQHGRFKKGGGGGGGRLRIISLVHLLSLFTISLSFTSLSISLVHFKVNYSASVYPGMRWPTASHLHGNAVLYLPLATSVLFHLSHCPHRCASTCDLCSTPTMGTKRGVRAHTHAHPHTHSTLVWM